MIAKYTRLRYLMVLMPGLLALLVLPLWAKAASPTAPMAGYSITQPYSWVYANGEGTGHNGVDMKSSDTRILAPLSGTVTVRNDVSANYWGQTAPNPTATYGTFIVIKSTLGGVDYHVYLAHMVYGSVTVSVGSRVQQGDVVGTMGNTGRSSGPHLHFEVRKGGTSQAHRMDPMAFLKLQSFEWSGVRNLDEFHAPIGTVTLRKEPSQSSTQGTAQVSGGLLHVVQEGNSGGIPWYKVDYSGSIYYATKASLAFEAGNVWTEVTPLQAVFETNVENLAIKSLPLDKSTTLKRVPLGYRFTVLESGKNYFGNLWYKLSDSGTVCYAYSKYIERVEGVPFTYTLVNQTYPPATLLLGKSFGLRGDITASHVISSLTASIVRVSDGAIVQSKSIYPNATTATLYGPINNAIIFNSLPAGSYDYLVSMEVPSANRQVELITARFTVAAQEAPVIVTGNSISAEHIALGESLTAEIQTSFGVGAVQYRYQVYCNDEIELDTGYGPSRILTYTPTREGVYVFFAQAKDSVSEDRLDGLPVTVSKPFVAVQSIQIEPVVMSLFPGEKALMQATISPANATDPRVSWQSSDITIANIDADGMVLALRAGEVEVRATAQDGSSISATSGVYVDQRIERLSLDVTTLSLTASSQQQLSALIEPGDASYQSLLWTSSDEAVATVDDNGLVVVTGFGIATVTVKSLDGSELSATCQVAVLPVSPPPTRPPVNTQNPAPSPTSKPSVVLLGDANSNGELDVEDITAIIDFLVDGKNCPSMANADADESGRVDIKDILWLVQRLVQ